MTRNSLIRLGGLAAILGGAVYGVVGLREQLLVEYLYYMSSIGNGFVAVLLPVGAMAAIAALHTLQKDLYGWVGAVLSLTAFVGLALATGALTVGVHSTSPDLDVLVSVLVIGLLVATVGLVLLGGLTVATGALPRWCGLALMAGSPLGVFLTMMPSATLGGVSPLGEVLQALGGLPWVLVGYAIFRAAARPPERSSRVR